MHICGKEFVTADESRGCRVQIIHADPRTRVGWFPLDIHCDGGALQRLLLPWPNCTFLVWSTEIGLTKIDDLPYESFLEMGNVLNTVR